MEVDVVDVDESLVDKRLWSDLLAVTLYHDGHQTHRYGKEDERNELHLWSELDASGFS